MLVEYVDLIFVEYFDLIVVEGLAVIGFVFGMMGIVALVRVEN